MLCASLHMCVVAFLLSAFCIFFDLELPLDFTTMYLPPAAFDSSFPALSAFSLIGLRFFLKKRERKPLGSHTTTSPIESKTPKGGFKYKKSKVLGKVLGLD